MGKLIIAMTVENGRCIARNKMAGADVHDKLAAVIAMNKVSADMLASITTGGEPL